MKCEKNYSVDSLSGWVSLPSPNLQVFDLERCPTKITRVFTITDGPNVLRGGHAHKKCLQILYCINGLIEVITDKCGNRISATIEKGGGMVEIPPGVWSEQIYKSQNSTLIVFCDRPFDENDYIREYSEYLAWCKL